MNVVKQSLLLCIGTLLALLALQGGLSLWHAHILSQANVGLVADAHLTADARQVLVQFNELERTLESAVGFTDTDQTDALRKQFQRHGRALEEGVRTLQSNSRGALRLQADKVAKLVHDWLQLARPHVDAEPTTALPSYHLLDDIRAALSDEVDRLVEHAETQVATSLASNHAIDRRTTWITVLALLLAIALGSWLGWRAMQGLHRQLGADAAEVAHIVSAVADGDLTIRIRTEGIPAGSVMDAMGRMQQALQRTVRQVQDISRHLADGSNDIASGNNDLSSRTEQQAAALERTAATMATLGDTVRHNADSADQASRLADHATVVAQQGGGIMGQAVQTMQDIHHSARKIADIIGVIDGIAFQTNILALNAAVESARAGEQGRGFAVVASEVRALAQRTAEAAKEVKHLITASAERVESGSALVNEAGATMRQIVQAIEQVNQVMSEIRVSSQQQSTDLGSVARSVQELDRATQQNAALAEQSAAAAESLKQQGQELVEVMSFFKVG